MTALASLLVRKATIMGGVLPYKQNLLGAFEGTELVATFHATISLEDAAYMIDLINGRAE